MDIRFKKKIPVIQFLRINHERINAIYGFLPNYTLS